ncbi:hypothetical protein F52700_7279 [Fusarium sp. NRRL 52700]|nr:hypothetical protein F52700_7279 [Fusarium sp. NRRL 52700]
MDSRPLSSHFHEYRCIVCNSVLKTRRSMRPRTEYVPTDRCYNCNYEASYSLATHDEASSQEFVQTWLPVMQTVEQIANRIAEVSGQSAHSRSRTPSTIDEVLEPDDEPNMEPSLYDETPEAAVQYPQEHDRDYMPATLFYSPGRDSPELDKFQLELSQLAAWGSELYIIENGFVAPEGEAPELAMSGSDTPEEDAYPVHNAPGPQQSPNEQEEGLNDMRDS